MYNTLEGHFGAFGMLQGPEGNALKSQMEAEIKKALDPGTVTAGTQTPTAFTNAGQFSPLVNEDLDQMVTAIDFKAHHLAFFEWLPKGEAKQTVVQYVRWLSHGSVHIDHATMEGELSVANASQLTRGKVEIKQYTETRSITDIANAQLNSVGGNAVVPSEPLAFQTQEGMLTLHRGLERDTLFGDSAVAENKIDGVVTQLYNAGQYEDLAGQMLTMDLLEEKVRDKQSAPYFGMPTDIFVTPKVFTSLSKQQIAMARREMDGAGILYGFRNGGLKLIVGDSELAVTPLIFLDDRSIIPVSTGMTNGTSLPAWSTGDTVDTQPTMSVGVTAGSQFETADLGDYAYAVMGFNSNGFTAWLQLDGGNPDKSVTVTTAGHSVSFILKNQAFDYYKVFRTPKNTALQVTASPAADALVNIKKFQYIGMIAKGAGTTTFTDLNTERNNAYKTLILRKDPTEIELYQLIKMMRIPLARLKAVQPFYLITAVGLAVKAPEHMLLLTNCGVTN